MYSFLSLKALTSIQMAGVDGVSPYTKLNNFPAFVPLNQVLSERLGRTYQCQQAYLHCQQHAIGRRIPQSAVESIELMRCHTDAVAPPLLQN